MGSKVTTLHQIDFSLILTLGPSNWLGYYFVLWHKVKVDIIIIIIIIIIIMFVGNSYDPKRDPRQLRL